MKKKKRTYKQSDDYLNKLEEWQEHQYDPGYYTGGNLPPLLTHPGRPKLLGWFNIISSVVCALILTPLLIIRFDIKQIIPICLLAMLCYGVFIAEFIGGIRYIKKGSTKEQYEKFKKFMFKTIYTIIATIIIITILNITILKREDVVESNSKRSEFTWTNNKPYIIINQGKLKLKCNDSQFKTLWESTWVGHNPNVKIEYQYNILNPRNGKVVKVETVE